MIQIYNSLSKQKEPLEPVAPNHVKIYVCGQTVYDYCHIGHARSMIVFDMVVRYLRARDFQVTYVRNITDIDDKIIRRALENDEAPDALTERFIHAMHEDEHSLKLLAPDHEPKATDYIPQIIELIQKLIDNQSAYIASNGDVCFDVRRFQNYGKLSHRDVDQLIAGARIDVTSEKKDPLDFVLWKLAKPNEPKWSSPWGQGRPGWHIECSAMCVSLLGQPFDIHGGGMDLKFPHHENEIAQSEAAMGCQFAKIWMHAGLLQVNDEKMSKSLGNFYTIREVVDQHDVEVIRYFMLTANYRSPVNYADDNFVKARQSLVSLYTAIRGLPKVPEKGTETYVAKFQAVMDDDFNSPQAFAVLFDMAHDINRLRESSRELEAAALASGLIRMAGVFGVCQKDPDDFLRGPVEDDQVAQIETLIKKRTEARQQNNWSEADVIRKQLSEMGVVIEDGANGTTWRRE